MGHVQVERAGGIVTVTLSNPGRRNAIPSVAWPDVEAVFREVATRAEDRCVVLTGEGGDFCSGADVSPDGAARGDQHGLNFMRTVSAAVEALHAVPQPVVARVDGVCVGVGLNMALGCDIVVASAEARFSEIFARRGLSIDGGGSWVLPRIVGLQKAKELALLAEVISAAEAERLGLVTRVVPSEELDATVADIARRLAAGPPLALSSTKRLLNQGLESSLAQALEAEALAQAVNMTSGDTAEAMAAFAEKREPTFEGH